MILKAEHWKSNTFKYTQTENLHNPWALKTFDKKNVTVRK